MNSVLRFLEWADENGEEPETLLGWTRSLHNGFMKFTGASMVLVEALRPAAQPGVNQREGPSAGLTSVGVQLQYSKVPDAKSSAVRVRTKAGHEARTPNSRPSSTRMRGPPDGGIESAKPRSLAILPP